MRHVSNGYMKGIDLFAAVVLAIGGLCWGAIGFFGFNPIEAAFGPMSPISRMIYVMFGLAALYEIIFYRMIQRRWDCKLWPEIAEGSPA
jgi:uncharacterized membrane protein YuzA (DUF378 family)